MLTLERRTCWGHRDMVPVRENLLTLGLPSAGQGLPAPTSPSYQMGSKDTTVPVCAAWMIVSGP